MNAESEEKGRSIFETAVYSLGVLATAASVWAFATGAVITPGMNRAEKPANFATEAQVDQPIVIAARG